MKNGIKIIWLRDGAEETHDTLMNILNNRIKLLDKPEEEKRKLAKYLENYYKLEKMKKSKHENRLIRIKNQSAFSCSFLYIASPVKRIGY